LVARRAGWPRRLGAAIKTLFYDEMPQEPVLLKPIVNRPVDVHVTVNLPNMHYTSEFTLDRVTADIDEAVAAGVANGISEADARERC
jgi:hypothetical protein